MIRDIVGGAGEAIEGEDNRPVTFADEQRRDGKIFVPMPFAG